MSKYIPGNQKHLTLEDRIYIEDELNRGTTFKDIAKFYARTLLPYPRSKAHRISDWYHKALSIMQKVSAYTGITVENKCLWKIILAV